MTTLNAYVDETGDLGWGDRASDIFAMSAIIVDNEREGPVRQSLADLREWLQYPPGTTLQWKSINHHEKRLHVADTVANQPLTVIQVCMFKRFLQDMNREPEALYLYTLRFMVERLTWLGVRRNRIVRARFAQIRAIGADRINQYLTRIRRRIPNQIEWGHLEGARVLVHRLEQYELLQYADLTAGPIYNAFVPSSFGYTINDYLVRLSEVFWRPSGSAYPTYGFKVFPGPARAKLAQLENEFPVLGEVG